MKWEKWIYLFAFLCGVILVNILEGKAWIDYSLFSRYNLASLSFQELVYEEYLLQILCLRFRTVLGLWVGTKLIPKKIVVYLFAIGVSGLLGSQAAMMILANGIWGILLFGCALLPQGLFYAAAFVVWSYGKTDVLLRIGGKERIFKVLLILVLTGIGCICEAFVSPVLLENIIK